MPFSFLRNFFPLILFILLAAQFCTGQSIVVQPPSGTFVMRSDLIGKHPRLYFTAADTAGIRQRAQGSCKWFYDHAKQSYGHYKGGTPTAPGSWLDYLYGFWGQFSMCMFYLVERDTAYANTARDWALFYARRSDWLADDLIPMEITSGMALTYDILYSYLTPSQRAELRTAMKRSIDTIQAHIFVGDYWTQDFQNNHMHNRIHGIAHAAFAMYGDDANINVQSTADLALGCFQQVVRWLPDDGSTHEGPGYWDYGYHWVLRTADLIKHMTGTDPAAGAPHFLTDHLYRLYMSTPGWNSTFGIGDAGEGPPDNVSTWMLPIARAQDAESDSVFRLLMQRQPGSFYQHTIYGLLWYDAALQPKPFAAMPLSRFWPDLEMFSIRGSWADTATAFVFKCGPPGGNRMQTLRGSDWVNVAHDHPDQNHFLLFAGGRMLAQDDGYPTDRKLTSSHNTIVIDTLGQTRDGEGWYQPFDYSLCGHLDDVMLSGPTACAAGNASKLYTGAARFIRHIAFIEGGYVISMDDLAGTGSGAHTFDWRLHKNGTWRSGQPGQFFVDDSSNMRLEIRFLEPAAGSIQGSFLPAALTTVEPCLSARVAANSTRITAVLTPQHNSQPALTSQMLSATGGAAVQVQGNGFTDVFAVRSDTAGVTAGDIFCRGTHALVRRQGTALTFALMTRGTLLAAGGRDILRSKIAANLSWRGASDGATVEAEPAYKDAGGNDSLGIGGLTASKQYDLLINGTLADSPVTDVNGVARISVNLSGRTVIRLTDGGVKIETPQPTAMSGLTAEPNPFNPAIILRFSGSADRILIYDSRGSLVEDLTGRFARNAVRWDAAGRAPGVYLVKVLSAGRTYRKKIVLMK